MSASPSPTSSAGGPSAPNPTALTVAAQVQRLIEEATSHVNLAQMYIGQTQGTLKLLSQFCSLAAVTHTLHSLPLFVLALWCVSLSGWCPFW